MTTCENIPIQYLPPVPAPRKRRAGGAAPGSQGWRGKYFATLADHGLRFKDSDLRHAFNSVIAGKGHVIRGTSEWTDRQKSAWLDRFAHHCEHCPGGDRCTALLAAQEMVP